MTPVDAMLRASLRRITFRHFHERAEARAVLDLRERRKERLPRNAPEGAPVALLDCGPVFYFADRP